MDKKAGTEELTQLRAEMDEARAAQDAAEARYRSACRAMADYLKAHPEAGDTLERMMVEMGAEETRSLRPPFEVHHFVWGGGDYFRRPMTGVQGGWVAVRPVGEEYGGKTYLGVLIGDLCQPLVRYACDVGTLVIEPGMGNPAMWVPELNKVVMGYGSWWSKLKSADDLRQITDADIDNAWYVRAMKELSGEGERPAQV